MTTKEFRTKCKDAHVKNAKIQFISILHTFTYSKTVYKPLTIRDCWVFANEHFKNNKYSSSKFSQFVLDTLELDMNRRICKGKKVKDFIKELEPKFDDIMNNKTHRAPFTSKLEVKIWCRLEQIDYSNNIPEVTYYFKKRSKL